MDSGDLASIPPAKWHGIWNRGPYSAQALFGYLGAGSLEAAGYDVHSPDAD